MQIGAQAIEMYLGGAIIRIGILSAVLFCQGPRLRQVV